MEKVGTSRSECGSRSCVSGHGGELALSIALIAALSAGALLILLVSIFSTTDRFAHEWIGTAELESPPRIMDGPTAQASRLPPGMLLFVSSDMFVDDLAPLADPQGKQWAEARTGQVKWPPPPEELWPVPESRVTESRTIEPGAKALVQLSMNDPDPARGVVDSPAANEGNSRESRAVVERGRPPVPLPSGLWLLGAGIIGLLGLRMKYYA
jgi:hypothetical protein